MHTARYGESEMKGSKGGGTQILAIFRAAAAANVLTQIHSDSFNSRRNKIHFTKLFTLYCFL